IPVLLFDIVPKDASDRNVLAKGAIEKLLKANPAPLTHKRNVKRITPCNLEDDLKKLGEVDWIIEAVLEREDIKHAVYEKVEKYRKVGSIVSSNTSTLPLHVLVKNMPERFRKDFLITHFFNPPRYMRLLELIGSADTRPDALETMRQFCDIQLGKGVVPCKDTPGFIANRIGIFWLAKGLLTALDQNISVEAADAVMGKPVGIPKTGVFGLLDLIGIDLLPLIAKSFADTLSKEDAFLKLYREPERITQMIADGYTGRKGKGGFYRMNTEDGKKIKEAINLQTGEYGPAQKVKLESINAARGGLRALVTFDDEGGRYAWEVLRDTLHYTASLVPEISDDIRSIDEAMRLGYNWKYGPFELIDQLGSGDKAGPAWFAEALRKDGLSIPSIIEKAGNAPFYRQEGSKTLFLNTAGKHEEIPFDANAFMLADHKAGKKPVVKNPSAALWDIGEGIACLEFTSKMNALDPLSLEMVVKSIEAVKENFRGLVIGNDADNFCVGANIGVLLFAANVAAWKEIDGIIKQGQDAYAALKFSPFPVVGAPSGMALGGGCEILLHCDAVNAHIELYTGLVEVGVGVIPGWGGCKEMLLRGMKKRLTDDRLVSKFGRMFSIVGLVRSFNTMPVIQGAFEKIALVKVSKSAEEARDMLILNSRSRITMNRRRVLSDARSLCVELTKDYTVLEPQTIALPGRSARNALEMGIRVFAKSGKATPHDVVVSKAVAKVLSGGNTSITHELTEQDLLNLERETFTQLIREPGTLARIEHMLETGKPLRN
ncbi:MAG: hypothetical protein KDD76_04500, partial [Rickettsiales bacterium]|nr:hypothetical protein [Rickettsiales bacterium]